MKPRGFALAAGLLMAAWAAQQTPTPGAAPKQVPATPAPAQADELSRISVDVTNVDVLFTVTDKRGRFVTDLNKDDFELIENKKGQTIRQFSAESDLPLRLGILVDTSNSIRERFKFEQQAASQFVRQVLKTDLDKAMIISFDSTAQLVSDLTNDTGVLDQAIQGLRAGGGTSLYDAIYFACRDKLSLDQPKSKYRRALVILSDGEDNQSHYTREQAMEMAQRADTVIFSISTNITRSETEGDRILTYFAKETGGRVYFPFKIEDLAQHFENVRSELSHQYVILYRPDPLATDGLFHKFELKVKNRKDLFVRVRPGYYAPKM
jgi:Ca-activated chloride channel family protein